MELPDEAVTYHYQGLLVPIGEEWTNAAELRTRYFLPPASLKDLLPRLMQAKSQVAAEREARTVPAEALPVDAGFIDLPQNLLDQYRRKGEASELGRVLKQAAFLRENADRIVILGAGGSHLGPRALFDALKSAYHNEMPAESRLGTPRIYFEGSNADNDSLQDLLDLIQVSCVEPQNREERWAVVAISKSGDSLESLTALRVFRRDASEYYGLRSEWLKRLFVGVTGAGTKLHELFKAEGYTDEEIFTIPDNVGGRFSVFTPAGLLPAALMGLDVRALLQGAATMTKRFLEEPFERNLVLQFTAVNHLMSEEVKMPLRLLAVWTRKLEALGWWYDQLVTESLGKRSRGPTPLTMLATRDLHTRGQQNQEGPRDRVINNLIVKSPRALPIGVQMADHNQDDLNQFARKTIPDILQASLRVTTKALHDAARPSADLIVPTLSEMTMGQLMQMLMLSTAVEGRLMGINPYSQPAVEAFKRGVRESLKA
jgi:glucose-6-phosphate isomerase